jgi:hypothetical protein
MLRTLVMVVLVCSGCDSGQGATQTVHPSWGPMVVIASSPVPAIQESHFGPKLKTEAECLSAQGSWGVVGESSQPRCIVPTTDGGTPCNDHAQCQGLCLADWKIDVGQAATGQCSATYYELECLAWIYGGRVGRQVCLD